MTADAPSTYHVEHGKSGWGVWGMVAGKVDVWLVVGEV
jgi:hypothetical protein